MEPIKNNVSVGELWQSEYNCWLYNAGLLGLDYKRSEVMLEPNVPFIVLSEDPVHYSKFNQSKHTILYKGLVYMLYAMSSIDGFKKVS